MDLRLRNLLLVFAILPLSVSIRFKLIYADPLISGAAACLFCFALWNFSLNVSRNPELRDTISIYSDLHKERQIVKRVIHPKYHYKFWLYGAVLGFMTFANLTAMYNIWYSFPLRYGLAMLLWGVVSALFTVMM
jgi:hypothetical protein